jgi:hypothetical protein
MPSDPEKVSIDYVERTVSDNSNELNDARIAKFTLEEQKKIIRKVDCRLVLTLGALYACSLMDRTNLGAVNIAGYVRISLSPELSLMRTKHVERSQASWRTIQFDCSNILYPICAVPATGHCCASESRATKFLDCHRVALGRLYDCRYFS